MRKLRRKTRLVGLLAALLAAAVFLARTLGPGGAQAPSADDPELATYAPEEAADHIGERALVCGRVVDAAFAEGVGGTPTFLNFGRPYPEQPFTAVIWGRDRRKFERPEVIYRGTRLCVAGRIREHEGTPQIEVRDPRQIRVLEAPR